MQHTLPRTTVQSPHLSCRDSYPTAKIAKPKHAISEWAIENQAALAERCRVLESEGGTAAERLYGVIPHKRRL